MDGVFDLETCIDTAEIGFSHFGKLNKLYLFIIGICFLEYKPIPFLLLRWFAQKRLYP